ncbi:uncharacterized protein METZ01_LOCUS460110, partial [marine metagenome]
MSFLHTSQSRLFLQIANSIIPPMDNMPGAGDIDILNHQECDIGTTPKQKKYIIEFLDKTIKTSSDLFESQFEDLTETNKLQILKKIEANSPNLFNSMIQIVYTGYYSNPNILKAKQLPVKAFQPDGFEMKPFEKSSVKK